MFLTCLTHNWNRLSKCFNLFIRLLSFMWGSNEVETFVYKWKHEETRTKANWNALPHSTLIEYA